MSAFYPVWYLGSNSLADYNYKQFSPLINKYIFGKPLKI